MAPESISARVKDNFASDEDRQFDLTLRPTRIDEYVGQRQIKENLAVFTRAAKQRREPVDHLLFSGPPGLGKTSLAHLVALEMGVKLHVTSGPALEKKGDLAGILTSLEPGDVFFLQAPEAIEAAARLPEPLPETLVTKVRNRRAGFQREARLARPDAPSAVEEDDYY